MLTFETQKQQIYDHLLFEMKLSSKGVDMRFRNNQHWTFRDIQIVSLTKYSQDSREKNYFVLDTLVNFDIQS